MQLNMYLDRYKYYKFSSKDLNDMHFWQILHVNWDEGIYQLQVPGGFGRIYHPSDIFFEILGFDPYLLSPFAKKLMCETPKTQKTNRWLENQLILLPGKMVSFHHFPSNIIHVRSIYPHLAHFHGKCSDFFYVETLWNQQFASKKWVKSPKENHLPSLVSFKKLVFVLPGCFQEKSYPKMDGL